MRGFWKGEGEGKSFTCGGSRLGGGVQGGHLIDHWLKKINKLLIYWTDEVGWERRGEFHASAEVRAGSVSTDLYASTVSTQSYFT